jgi:hypothetical protein
VPRAVDAVDGPHVSQVRKGPVVLCRREKIDNTLLQKGRGPPGGVLEAILGSSTGLESVRYQKELAAESEHPWGSIG